MRDSREDLMIPVPDVMCGKLVPYTTDMVAAVETRQSKPIDFGHEYISPRNVEWERVSADGPGGTFAQEIRTVEFTSAGEHNQFIKAATQRGNEMVRNQRGYIGWNWTPGMLLSNSLRRNLHLSEDLCSTRVKVNFVRADKIKPLWMLLGPEESGDCSEDLEAFWIWLSVTKKTGDGEYLILVEVAANAYSDTIKNELEKLTAEE